jgi:hypothetical protein
MAQQGDTITYGFTDGTSVAEDVSGIDKAEVVFCKGAGGESATGSGAAGGLVENAVIDVTGKSTLYIFVGGIGGGRYTSSITPSSTSAGVGGGSSEVTFSNTDNSDSDDEPFLVGAGGGGGGRKDFNKDSSFGHGGGRGGLGGDASAADDSGDDGQGVAPPQGGNGEGDTQSISAGDGAIDDQNRGLVSGGTITKGGGPGPDTAGEVKISYKSPVPAAPSNLTATQQ